MNCDVCVAVHVARILNSLSSVLGPHVPRARKLKVARRILRQVYKHSVYLTKSYQYK